MMKKIAIGFLIPALLVAALVGIVTWQFSSLVTPQIERYLRRHGVETLSTSDVKWRFNRLRMEAVEASGNLDGNHLVVHLQNVDIGYQWWQLFDGSIDSIAIEQADIRLVLPATDDTAPPPDLLIPTLLPQAWLGLLPVDALSIASLAGNVESGDNWALAVQGKDLHMSASELTLQGTLVIRDGIAPEQVAAQGGAFTVLDITSSSSEPLNISVAVSSQQQLIANAALVWSAQNPQGDIQTVNIKGRADIHALTAQLNAMRSDPHPLLAWLPFDAFDGLPAMAGTSDFVLNLAIPAHIRDSYDAWLDQITIVGNASHHLAIASWPEMGLSEASAQIEHRISGNLAAQSIAFSAPITLNGTIAAGDWGMPGDFGEGKKGFDEWQGAIPLALQLEPGVLVLDASGWNIDVMQARLDLGSDNQRVSFNAVLENIAAQQESLVFASAISASITLDQKVLAAPRISAQVKQDGDGWRGKGDVTEDALTLSGQWQAEFLDNGAYGFSLKGKIASLPTLLKQAEGYMQLPLALVEGVGSFTYRLKGSLAESASTLAASQSLQFDLGKMTGLLEGVALQGASLQGTVENTGTWQSRDKIQFRVPALEVGVSIEEVAMAVQLLPAQSLAQTRWRVHALDAKLFSGAVTLREPFTLNYPLTETRFEMLLSNWQLGAILGLYAEHGLSGEGILSGVLPVRIGPDGVAIEAGVLASQPPGGRIVYDTGESGKAMAARNQQLDLAVTLLENFEFQSLSIKADFAPTGALLLGLQLSGRNPDAFSGRPVNFNINVEENLFDLFKALTLTDDVINKLEKRLNR